MKCLYGDLVPKTFVFVVYGQMAEFTKIFRFCVEIYSQNLSANYRSIAYWKKLRNRTDV